MLNYYLFVRKGAELDKIENSGVRVGGFAICAKTAEDLKTKHNLIAERIKVIGDNGEDMMRHDLLIETYLT